MLHIRQVIDARGRSDSEIIMSKQVEIFVVLRIGFDGLVSIEMN